jgi:CRISPR-associated endonuclease/helicase Cas3
LAAYYARTLDDQPKSAWQELEAHLAGVARRASEFAAAFDSAQWGYCAGLWHDLGKYLPEFQTKLEGSHTSVEHSGIGAAFAVSKHKELGLHLAFAIAGHHAGLANFISSGSGLPTPLKERLSENARFIPKLSQVFPKVLTSQPIPKLPEWLREPSTSDREELHRKKRRSDFWIRFLFSALVDADRLDSEEFCQPNKAKIRERTYSLAALLGRLESHISTIQAAAADFPVNAVRQRVLKACQDSASLPQGTYTLTVPTGGGKTLSAMSFALRHALHYALRRVIVVIPYTSIIEQNAQIYRHALGADQVIEHHSNLDPMERKASLGEEVASREELAAENWDAPVIVTTTVQFFDSLFSSRPSRCRKLHNIARSVVILDEVQSLPPGFLESILDALNELVRAYQCSIVLATATPPALKWRDRFPRGLRDCREIVPDPALLSRELRRVEYVWPEAERKVTPEQLAVELSDKQRVLAVVHRRRDARVTAQHLEALVQDGAVRHLSALMCPAHRSQVLQEIKERLKQGEPCRVVSTQLVEAGVDIDFPIVYRALGGLDSIVQAAGRCNREGRMHRGKVIVFRADSEPPPGTPRKALGITEGLLKERGDALNPDDPQVCEDYFRRLYFTEELDVKSIQTLREQFSFASVAREFQLIEDGFTQAVVVPFGDAMPRMDEFRRLGPSRERYRGLQPFIVNIYPQAFTKLRNAGALDEVADGIYALTPPFRYLYDSKYGLVVDEEPSPAVEALMV